MWFPSFWEFKRRFFSRVLKVPNDIVKSEFMLEPGIITCGLSDCNAVDEIGGSKWCGGVVVIRSPHDPEVPSSNPGKNNTSDFSIRDPLSLPSCDWYRIYLAMWWNSSVGRAADLIYTCQVRCHGFDSRCFPHI